MEYLDNIGKKAVSALKSLSKLKTKEKNEVLIAVAEEIDKSKAEIIKANNIDVENARQNNLKESFIDRLILDEKRINAIRDSMIDISRLDDPIGEFLSMKKLPNGLTVGQKRVGIGVIGMIYEARPNVTADAFSLCFKVSSAVILRGGKEAVNSNIAMVKIFRKVLEQKGINPDAVQLIEDLNRETTVEFMKLDKYVDVLIPRGSNSLIKTVVENSTIPTIETGVGNCHIFVDESASFEKAVDIIINAKTQRTGVCNACESLLVHKNISEKFVPLIVKKLREKNVEVRGDKLSKSLVSDIIDATEEDYYEEFLDLIISLKIVEDVSEAIEHISKYSTKHSEAIITESYGNSQKFLDEVDSAAVYVNASTRFTDGFEFGFGAEIGISTQKLHVRGPIGLKELTTTKYVIYGDGQIRP